MPEPIDRLLSALGAAGCDVADRGDGVHKGRCPSCGKDRLSIGESDRGVWVKCWTAECSADDIITELGLRWRDLFKDERDEPSSGAVTWASDIASHRPQWLWAGRVPLKGLTILAGVKGLGKSLLSGAVLAARVSTGTLEGSLFGRPARVLIVSVEDDWAAIVKPRLVASGADLTRVGRFAMSDGRHPILPDDVHAIREVIEAAPADDPVRLLVLDPLSALLAAGVDSHRDASTRGALAPLAAMVNETDIAALLVAHLGKDMSRSLLARVNGSVAIANAARSVLALVEHPDDEDARQTGRRVLLHVATNYGTPAPALEIKVASKLVEFDRGEPAEIGYLEIVGESDVTEADLRSDGRGDPQSVEEQVIDLLQDGELPSLWVKKEAAKAMKVHPRTVERAADRLQERGELERDKRGFPPVGYWRLASSDTRPTDGPVEPISDTSPKDVSLTVISEKPGPFSNTKYVANGYLRGVCVANGSTEEQSHGPLATQFECSREDRGITPPAIAELVTIDVETAGLDARRDELKLVGLAADDQEPVIAHHPVDREVIQRWLELPATFIAHNLQFDFGFLASNGYRLPAPELWADTQVLAHLAGRSLPGQSALRAVQRHLIDQDALAESILSHEDAVNAWVKQARRAARKAGRSLPHKGNAPESLLEPYLRGDIESTRTAWRRYGPQLNGAGPVWDLERRVLPAIYHCARRGVPVDLDEVEALQTRSAHTVGELRARCFELAGREFNPGSARQVEQVLIERGADLTEAARTPRTGQLQRSATALEVLEDELAPALTAYYAATKMAGYIDGLVEHIMGDRLYGGYVACGAVSGRMSSRSPNLQQVPARRDLQIRHCIAAPEGSVFVGADLTNIELLVLSTFAPGGELSKAMKAGTDLHQLTADACGVTRDIAKQINFGTGYGAGVKRVQAIIGCSLEEAREIHRRWHRLYPEVRRLLDRLDAQIRRRGYIHTPMGRQFHYDRPTYKALPHLISGSAAEIFKAALVRIHEAGARPVLLVHDEVVVEALEDDAEATVQLLTEALTADCGPFRGIRADAGIHRRWSQFKLPDYLPPADV